MVRIRTHFVVMRCIIIVKGPLAFIVHIMQPLKDICLLRRPGGWNSALYFRQEAVVHVAVLNLERLFSSDSRWQCLYFFPLPHQHISFLPSFGMGSGLPNIFSKNFIWHPIADGNPLVKLTFGWNLRPVAADRFLNNDIATDHRDQEYHDKVLHVWLLLKEEFGVVS